jgi:RHS repeat-associated protein
MQKSCGICAVVLLLSAVTSGPFSSALCADPFRRGDANASGGVDATDSIRTLEGLFLGGDSVGCEDAADANDDGEVNLSDAIHTLNYLYLGTAEIAAPGPDTCGRDPTPDALDCVGFRPCMPPERLEDAGPPCGRFFAGPLAPLDAPELCTGTRPPSRDAPRSKESAPGLGAHRVPIPDTPLPRTSVAWHGGAGHLPVGPSAQGSATFFRGPHVVSQLATDLYQHPGGEQTSLEFLASFEQGSVEVGQLGLVWGEVDRVYPGVTGDVDLVVGRRYYSRASLDGEGTAGARWAHSLHERLVFVDDDHVRHLSWETPYDDPDLYYVRTSHYTFHAPEGVGAEIFETTLSPSRRRFAGVAYELRWPDRAHYFDADGRIIARLGASGMDAIEFFYDAAGNLETVIDSRGQSFAVETTESYITKFIDPTGSAVDYEILEGRLARIRYAEREVVKVTDRSDSGVGLVYARERRATERRFDYAHGTGLLRAIESDGGETVLSITYADNFSGRVRWVTDANGRWGFETLDTDAIQVTTPRGFSSVYRLDEHGQPVSLEQRTQGSGPAPSRPLGSVPVEYRWQFVRGEACDCGRVTELVEPDGGGYLFDYDTGGRIERMEKRASAGRDGDGGIVWTWKYDTEGRVVAHVPPEAHERQHPEDYTFTLAITADTDRTNEGGTVYTVLTPAGGRHDEAVTWTWRVDEHRRVVEYVGPAHGKEVGSGDYDRFEYYAESENGESRAHLLARHQDRREGPWTEYEYNDAGLVERVTTRAGGKRYTFTQEWNAERQLTRWVAPRRGDQQYELDYGYDAAGRRVLSRYTYFGEPQKDAGEAIPNWLEEIRYYDASGNVTLQQRDVEPNRSALVAYAYDVEGALVQVIDPDGKVSRALYDERGLPWKTYDGYGTVEEVERQYFYNLDGQLARHHEPFGDGYAVLERTYDAFDRLKSVGAPGKLLIEDSFDAGGRVTSRVTQGFHEGRTVEVRHEEFVYRDWHDGHTDRTLLVYSEDGSEVLRTLESGVEYAPSSRPVVLSLGKRPYVTFEYTAWGSPAVVADMRRNRELFDYDIETGYLARHAHEQWDPVSRTARVYERAFVTDPAGRVLEISYNASDAPSRVYRYGYDSLDNPVRFVGARGVVTRRVYGYDGRLLEIRKDVKERAETIVGRIEDSGSIEAPRSIERYSYTTGGRVQAATDHDGRTVTFLYDERGRRRREVNADGSFWLWDYVGGDFVEGVTTPAGKRFDISYNDWGLPASRTVMAASGELLRTDRYTWNPLGDLRSVTKTEPLRTTTLLFTRDSLGKVLTESQDGDTVSYERDSLGRLQRLIGPSGFARHYAYDDHHRVREIREEGAGGPRVAALTYQGSGRSLRQLALGAGEGDAGRAGHLTVDRDGFGRVARMKTTHHGTTLFDFAYDYDPNGRVRYEERGHEEGRGDAFVYDRLDRLEHFVQDSENPCVHADDPGALALGAGGSLPYALKRQYHLDAGNHRDSVVTTRFEEAAEREVYRTHPDRHHYTAVGGVVRRQDLDGNVIAHGDRLLTYDAVLRLVEVEDAGTTTATYTYDPLGRRDSKTVGRTTTRYVHAGPWLIEEYRSPDDGVSEGGVADGGIADGEVLEELEAVHYHATGVDEVVLSKRRDHGDLDGDGDSNELIDLYLHRNRLGSVMALTLEDGSVVERYRYDAYGEPEIQDATGCRVPTPPSGNRFLFTGREYDPETGYYDYRARTYDPATGTFLQEDPLGLVDGLNPVAYVSANPSQFVDPLGTFGLEPLVVGLVGFLKKNRELLGRATGAFLDIVGPLGDLLDLFSAAAGYDIRDWIERGFRGVKEIGWFERLKRGAIAAAILAGGAIAIAKVFATLDKVYEKIRNLVNSVKNLGNPKVGQRVWRVCGGRSSPFGHYWVAKDPRSVANYRDALGLPAGNTGRFVSEGRLKDVTGVTKGKAIPLDGNVGGLDELRIPHPRRQIELDRVSGLNPEY